MPLTAIVGAQFGSEGKGKVAYWWARKSGASAAVRVGGPNSGHTVSTSSKPTVFRHLPTPALIPGMLNILPPGSYLDLGVLFREIQKIDASPTNLRIDPAAAIVTERERAEEASSSLSQRIGSTGSGTGATVVRRVRRDGSLVRAIDVPELQPFLDDTLNALRVILNDGGRVILEGTQGYGLSLLHGGFGDYATSRDTTASGALAEVGISPLDVDEVVLVARAFPIRVAGNSGPLPMETDWAAVGALSGRDALQEFTTVTHRLRRVAHFDPQIVVRAIRANLPTHLVLNHVDYVADLDTPSGRTEALQFIESVEKSVGREVDLIGIDPSRLISPATLRGALHSDDSFLNDPSGLIVSH
jgi:adenylosuccinate synthase